MPATFPGRPTLPGVLMVESLAQLGGIAVLLDPRYAGKLPALRRDRTGPVPPPGGPRRHPRARRSLWTACRPGPARATGRHRWTGRRRARPTCSSSSSTVDSRAPDAPGHLERELPDGPAAPRHAMDRAASARRPLPPGDQAGRRQVPDGRNSRPWATSRPTRRRPLERRGRSSAGWAWRTPSRASGSAEDEHGMSPRRRRPVAACGCTRSTCPTGAAWTTSSTPVKLDWLARLRTSPRRDLSGPVTRWPCAGTSTSPPTTATCGTRPTSSA